MLEVTITSLAVVCVVLYYFYVLFSKSSKLILTFYPTERNKRIVRRAHGLSKQVFTPTFYLLNGHLQTFFYYLSRLGKKLEDIYPYERSLVKLEDGGQISVDYILHPDVDRQFTDRTPIVVILPGLTGNRYCGYIKALIAEVCKRGFKAAVLNHRGCSKTPVTSPKLYCASSTDDTREGLANIKQRYPNNPIYGVGVSFGGTALGNLCAEEGDSFGLQAIVLICAPYEILLSERHITTNIFGIYNKALAYTMKKKVKEHRNSLLPMENVYDIRIDDCIEQVRDLRDYDRIFTTRFFSYKTPDDYYRKASLGYKLQKLKIPTLLLCPLDDPITPEFIIPYEEAMVNPNLIIATHPCAGHVAFLTGIVPTQWYPIPVLDFIDSVRNLTP